MIFLMLNSSSSFFLRCSGIYVEFNDKNANALARISIFHRLFAIYLWSRLLHALCQLRYPQLVDYTLILKDSRLLAYLLLLQFLGLMLGCCFLIYKCRGHYLDDGILHEPFFRSDHVAWDNKIHWIFINHIMINIDLLKYCLLLHQQWHFIIKIKSEIFEW